MHQSHRVMLIIAIAVLAAGAGFAVVTAVVHDVSASPAAASASPGATTGPGQTLRLETGGRVTAVSATSITLGAHGQSVTAAVTAATKVTGKVTDISGVKVGDLVSAQITGTDGKLTATAIQDPASIP
jgi:hypothetical protein